MKDEEVKQRKETAAFVKEAFCVDGDAVCMGGLSQVITETDGSMDGLTVRCFDKRRGVFFVTLSRPNTYQ